MIDPAFYTAFVASRICHDLVSPISSVSSALDMLDDPSLDEAMKRPSEDLLRDGAKKLQASILFLRYAFGSMGMSDSVADIHEAKQITERYVALHRPDLAWDIETSHFSYFHARMMMHLVLYGVACLPRGGLLTVRIKDHDGHPSVVVHAQATSPKPDQKATSDLKPEIVAAISGDADSHDWNARSIQALFGANVADQLGVKVTANRISESEIIFAANQLLVEAKVSREGIS
ncbi:MAG: histidine phosphotransferase family protein [Pseudomonadota bacterium]